MRMVVTMVVEHGVSYRQACKEVSISRTTVQYQHHPKDDKLLKKNCSCLWTNTRLLVFGNAITASGERGYNAIINDCTGYIQRSGLISEGVAAEGCLHEPNTLCINLYASMKPGVLIS